MPLTHQKTMGKWLVKSRFLLGDFPLIRNWNNAGGGMLLRYNRRAICICAVRNRQTTARGRTEHCEAAEAHQGDY